MHRFMHKGRANSKPINKATKKKRKKEGKVNVITALVPSLTSTTGKYQVKTEKNEVTQPISQLLTPKKTPIIPPHISQQTANSIYSMASEVYEEDPSLGNEDDVYEFTDSLSGTADQTPRRPTVGSIEEGVSSDFDDSEEDVYEITDSFNKVGCRAPQPLPDLTANVESDSCESDDIYSHLAEVDVPPVEPVSYDALRYDSNAADEAEYDSLHGNIKSLNAMAKSSIQQRDSPQAECSYEDVDLPFLKDSAIIPAAQVNSSAVELSRCDSYEDVSIEQPSDKLSGPLLPLVPPLPSGPRLPLKSAKPSKSETQKEPYECNSNDKRELHEPSKVTRTTLPTPAKLQSCNEKLINDSGRNLTIAQAMNFFKASTLPNPPKPPSKGNIKPKSEVVSRLEFGRIIKPRHSANRSTIEEKLPASGRIMKLNGTSPLRSPEIPRKNNPPRINATAFNISPMTMNESELAKSPLFLSMQQKLRLND